MQQNKKFQRTIEDFVCESCGSAVHGDGYRNHCPHCLISKHVDVHPGDRKADCNGLMDVVDIILDHGELILVHQCRRCSYQKKNKIHSEDNTDAITEYMQKRAHE